MRYMITSDNHFNHRKIIEYGRPEDYEDRILDGFKILTNEDLFINLGDFCIGRDAEFHARILPLIPCKKVLVKGNHDNKSYSWYINHGWDFVCDSFTLRYGNKNILFTHIPRQKSKSFDLNIHGHLHRLDRPERMVEFLEKGFEYDTSYHKLISLEDNGYRLTNLDELIR